MFPSFHGWAKVKVKVICQYSDRLGTLSGDLQFTFIVPSEQPCSLHHRGLQVVSVTADDLSLLLLLVFLQLDMESLCIGMSESSYL